MCHKPTLGTLEEDTDTTTTRLWVSHFGLLSSPTLSCRFPLSESSSALRSFDSIKECVALLSVSLPRASNVAVFDLI